MKIEQVHPWTETFTGVTGQALMVWGDHTMDGPVLHVFGFVVKDGQEQHFYRQLGVLGDKTWVIALPESQPGVSGITRLNQRAAEAFMSLTQTLNDTRTATVFQTIPRFVLFYPDQDFMPVAFWLLKNNPAMQAADWGMEMAHIKTFGVDMALRAMAEAGDPSYKDALTRELPAQLSDAVFEQWLIHLLDRQQQPMLVMQFAQMWQQKTAALDARYVDRLNEKHSFFNLDHIGEFLERLNFSVWPKDVRQALQSPAQ